MRSSQINALIKISTLTNYSIMFPVYDILTDNIVLGGGTRIKAPSGERRKRENRSAQGTGWVGSGEGVLSPAVSGYGGAS